MWPAPCRIVVPPPHAINPGPCAPQELQRNIKRELGKLRLLLQQYAVMAPGAQVFCSDQSGKLARSTMVSAARAGAALSAWGSKGRCGTWGGGVRHMGTLPHAHPLP